MPETRYARSGDVSIAYQVLGDGPRDVVVALGAVSHVELLWEAAGWAAWLRGVAGRTRVLVFDKRGTGMSDRVAGVPTLEERSDDIRAVMDAAGSERAALAGFSEGVPMSMVFAASYPERVSALVLYGGMARTLWAPDYLFGDTERAARQEVEQGFEEFLQPGGPEPYIRTGLSRGDEEEVHACAARAAPEPEKVLATIRFSDIVGSTARAAELGDARWRELLAEHHTRVRQQLARFRGIELDTAGDGFFARFDGPARAIRCAIEIRCVLRELGLEVRLGLHTGECEVLDGKVAGVAVSIGARVSARAAPGEVLVSQTVKDLVVGSGSSSRTAGWAQLTGEWRLYAVVSPDQLAP
jgi:class 3 adenylate cyclase